MEIEDNIPIPPKSRKNNKPRNEGSIAAHMMKAGQSIFCTKIGDHACAKATLRKLGAKFVSRKVDNGWRVWRLE